MCYTRKRRSDACNDRDELPCAPGTGVEHGTGHLVRQRTHCPPALPESVGLFLKLPRTAVMWSVYRSRTSYRVSRSSVT
jgi:hypothetical protein